MNCYILYHLKFTRTVCFYYAYSPLRIKFIEINRERVTDVSSFVVQFTVFMFVKHEHLNFSFTLKN